MSRINVLFIGFMLFSLFFGADNLIFPPLLGWESGDNFGPAITGFLITGVLLPFIGYGHKILPPLPSFLPLNDIVFTTPCQQAYQYI